MCTDLLLFFVFLSPAFYFNQKIGFLTGLNFVFTDTRFNESYMPGYLIPIAVLPQLPKQRIRRKFKRAAPFVYAVATRIFCAMVDTIFTHHSYTARSIKVISAAFTHGYGRLILFLQYKVKYRRKNEFGEYLRVAKMCQKL